MNKDHFRILAYATVIVLSVVLLALYIVITSKI